MTKLLMIVLVVAACGGGKKKEETTTTQPTSSGSAAVSGGTPCEQEIALECPEGQIDGCLKTPREGDTHACVAK